MDPITRAARKFTEEADRHWRSGRSQILRMVASPSERTDLVKLLRAEEWSPHNRRPLFLLEQTFTSTEDYCAQASKRIRDDYTAVRDGLAKDKVSLAPFPEDPSPDGVGSIEQMLWHMEQAANLLTAPLEGALFALVPRQIKNGKEWCAELQPLVRAKLDKRVRIALYDPPDGPLECLLKDHGQARFLVDPDELLEFLKEQASGGKSAGPPTPPPKQATPEQRRAVEESTGVKLIEPQLAQQLRMLLLEAAQATGKRQHDTALAKYGAALELCEQQFLVIEQAMVLMALAGAHLQLEDSIQALACYRRTVDLAEGKSVWILACQAWLGIGGVLLREEQYIEAAKGYEEAAAMAQKGQVSALRIESLRLAGTCYLLGRERDQAVRCWQDAVHEGAGLLKAERTASTFAQVASELVSLLERLRLREQALHVQSLIEQDANEKSK